MRLSRLSTGPDGEPEVDVRITADDLERLRRRMEPTLSTSDEDDALWRKLTDLQRDLFAEMDDTDAEDPHEAAAASAYAQGAGIGLVVTDTGTWTEPAGPMLGYCSGSLDLSADVRATHEGR